MLNVGLLVSTKFACNIKFDSIENVTVVPLVIRVSGRLVPPVQLVKAKPVPAVAVME